MIDSYPCLEAGETSPKVSSRPTLSAVARAAKVSLATASYALRNNPKIPKATRQHVCAVAKGLGYRPNPELGRLMFLLRDRQRPPACATIALLESKSAAISRRAFNQALEQGLNERCGDLGYNLDRIVIDPETMSARRITDILLHRGVQGVLLGPSIGQTHAPLLHEGAELPVIAMTRLARLHHSGRMILPHHLQIAELGLNRMREAGWYRIGWVAEERTDQGEYFLYHTAVIMAQQAGLTAPIPALSYSGPTAATTWRQRHQPDAVLVPNEQLAAKIHADWSASGQPILPLCVLDRSNDSRWPGIDQHPLTIGHMAIESMARLIQTGSREAPECVSVTMVEGSWVGQPTQQNPVSITARPTATQTRTA